MCNRNKVLRSFLILLVVVGGVAQVGVRNVRAKIARCRIGAAQEMAESFCCMVENYMSDHRMSEPPKDLRVLLALYAGSSVDQSRNWSGTTPRLLPGSQATAMQPQ